MTALQLCTESYFRASHAVLAHGRQEHMRSLDIYANKIEDPAVARIAEAARRSIAVVADRCMEKVG